MSAYNAIAAMNVLFLILMIAVPVALIAAMVTALRRLKRLEQRLDALTKDRPNRLDEGTEEG